MNTIKSDKQIFIEMRDDRQRLYLENEMVMNSLYKQDQQTIIERRVEQRDYGQILHEITVEQKIKELQEYILYIDVMIEALYKNYYEPRK